MAADVFTVAKITVSGSEVPGLEGYSLKVSLPKPNGPFVFGVEKSQLEKLAKDIAKLLKSSEN